MRLISRISKVSVWMPVLALIAVPAMADSIYSKSNAYAPVMPVGVVSESPNQGWLNGPYKTDVNIVDSQVKFRNYVFRSVDFDGWMQQYQNALAFSQFESWIQSGVLDIHGKVMADSARLGELSFPKDKAILPQDLLPFFKSQFQTQYIFNSLIQQGILKNDGQISGAEKVTQSNFDERSFSYISVAINKMDLKIPNKALENSLKNSLYDLILSRIQVLSVTRQEDTHYESRRSGFFESFADNIAGNLLGRVFYPQRVQTDVHEVAWISKVYIPDYFSFYRFGFNDYAFANNQGVRLLNGKSQRYFADLYYMNDGSRNPSVQAATFKLDSSSLSDLYRYSSDPVLGWNFRYDRITSAGDSIQMESLGFNVGTMSDNTVFQFGLGATLRQAQSNLYLGWNLGFNYELYFYPFSLNLGLVTMGQPDLFRTGFSWGNTFGKAGVNAHFGQFTLGGGYQYIGGASATIGTGPYVEGSVEF